MTVKKFDIQLVKSEKVSRNIMFFSFKKLGGDSFDFIPGQFITFLFKDKNSKIKRRSYSIANIVKDIKVFEIAVSKVKDGLASKKLFNMRVGYQLSAMGPFGKFVLRDKERIRKLILVGTGTGIVPYYSMLKDLRVSLLNNVIEEVHILAGVRFQSDAIYSDEFRHCAEGIESFYFRLCLSRENSILKSDERKGYVQKQLENIDLDKDQDLVYLCGNPNMVESGLCILKMRGFSTERIRREKYISSH